VTVKKDSLLVYVLKFFGILAGRCASQSVGREIRIRGLQFSFFLIETLPMVKTFPRVFKNCSDRLRKGQLPRDQVRSFSLWKETFGGGARAHFL